MDNNISNETIVRDMASNNGGIVTVKHIYMTCNHVDGGKRLRDYLRKNFPNHPPRTSWEWSIDDDTWVNVLKYAQTINPLRGNKRVSNTVKTTTSKKPITTSYDRPKSRIITPNGGVVSNADERKIIIVPR